MSDPDTVVHEALRWLQFSKEDLDVALRLLSGSSSAPRHVCWLSQQAAERASRAALVPEEVEFPFSHDLDALRNLLPGTWSVRDTHPDLAELTEWAVETSYPGDWPEPTDADVTLAESQPRSVNDCIVSEFRLRGALAE